MLNDDNNNQIGVKRKNKKILTKHILCYRNFLNINISKKLKLSLTNTIIDKMVTYESENWTLTKKDREQLNIFERKAYRRILGPVYDKENENWRILTNKEIQRFRVRFPALPDILSSSGSGTESTQRSEVN